MNPHLININQHESTMNPYESLIGGTKTAHLQTHKKNETHRAKHRRSIRMSSAAPTPQSYRRLHWDFAKPWQQWEASSPRRRREPNKVVPPVAFSSFISGLTMVYGR